MSKKKSRYTKPAVALATASFMYLLYAVRSINVVFILRDSGTMFQYRLRSYVEAAAMHESGAWTDAEYELWKSKAPMYFQDVRKVMEQRRSKDGEELSDKTARISGERPQTRKHRRKRKINNGH